MKKLLFGAALIAAGSLGIQGISSGHGGTYRGPGDTVPPGGGGGGGGGGPSAPGPAGPSAPGPGAPKSGGPSTPGIPAGGPGGPNQPRTGGAAGGVDLTVWQFWWAFNREPFLNLKAAIHSGAVITGSDDFYLGRGEKDQSKDTLRPSEADIRGKVVPALLKALETERSNDILTGSMVALAKIGDAKGEDGASKMAEAIKPFLTNGSQEVAETAAVSLGILANPENVDLLISMLHDDNAALRGTHGVQMLGKVNVRSRSFAAYGLGLIGYNAEDSERVKIVEALTRLLSGEGKSMGRRDVQVGCLIAMGLTPLPIGGDAAPAEGAEGEEATMTAPQTRSQQLRWLMDFYKDDTNNFLIRAHAPTAMARLLRDVPADFEARTEVAQVLIDDLSNHSTAQAEIQQSCALALGEIGDCDADEIDSAIRETLISVKDNVADQQTRNFAIVAIAQVGGRPGQGDQPVLGVTTDNKKENARNFLLGQLAKGKNTVKPWAGLAIGLLERSLDDAKQDSSRETRDALRAELAASKTPEDVGAFAIAVGVMKDPGAKDILLDKLDNVKDVEARGYVAVALGLMNERSAVQPIQEIVKKSKYQPELLKSAAIGLGLLGDKQLVPDLIEMLADANGLSAQAAISNALGFIGDARSIDPLIAMLEDDQKTDLARGFAAVALGIVADKEPLPWNAKISVNINYRANTVTLTDGQAGILDIL